MSRFDHIVVHARFVGRDGSLGYRNGQTYALRVWSTWRYPAIIERLDGGGRCPYSSLASFLRNWEAVSPASWERHGADLAGSSQP